jgi:hypothetical protein
MVVLLNDSPNNQMNQVAFTLAYTAMVLLLAWVLYSWFVCILYLATHQLMAFVLLHVSSLPTDLVLLV